MRNRVDRRTLQTWTARLHSQVTEVTTPLKYIYTGVKDTELSLKMRFKAVYAVYRTSVPRILKGGV